MMHMGEKHAFPGMPDPETTISAASVGSVLRKEAMERAGRTEVYFETRRKLVIGEAERDYRSSGKADGIEEFVAAQLASHHEKTAAGLAHFRQYPDQFRRALEAGTIKLFYIDTSSPEAMRLGVQEVAPGYLSRKEILQATRHLRLDAHVKPIVFHLARFCVSFFMKQDLLRWANNAFNECDDAVLLATDVLARRLARDPELQKDDARGLIQSNCPNVSWRRFEAEVWPNARQKVGLSRNARSGPKRKRRPN